MARELADNLGKFSSASALIPRVRKPKSLIRCSESPLPGTVSGPKYLARSELYLTIWSAKTHMLSRANA